MNGRFAVDTNTVVDYLRENRSAPPALLTASEILLPLTVLGELFAGAFASERDLWPHSGSGSRPTRDSDRADKKRLLDRCTVPSAPRCVTHE
jgi:predicted nucleic acid-binding protein